MSVKEVKNDIRYKYQYGDYNIYVKVDNQNYCHFYLENNLYGVVMFMFAVIDDEKIFDICLSDNVVNEYIDIYRTMYED